MTTERWGDFVLLDSFDGVKLMHEFAAPRPDFRWPHEAGVWDHPLATRFATVRGVNESGLFAFPAFLPSGEELLDAVSIGDSRGAVEAWLSFNSPERKSINGHASTAPQGTTQVLWTLRAPRPLYFVRHSDPRPVSAPTMERAGVVELSLGKAEVAGRPAVLRVFEGRNGMSLLDATLPQIVLQWFEGPVFFAVWTHSNEDAALRIAESLPSRGLSERLVGALSELADVTAFTCPSPATQGGQ